VVALLLRIQEVVILNPDMETGYPEVLNGFLQSFQAKAGIVLQRKPRPLSSTSFPIHHPLIIP
jgi:hypothetical protein